MPATLQIKDLSPKFLAFYEQAQDADPERRWELWNELYGVAAVPPTEEGKKMARRLLDESFHRYPEVMDRIRAGAAGFRPEPGPLLEATCRTLDFDGDLEIVCTFYVGNLEKNAWAAPIQGRYYVFLPLEWDMTEVSFVLPHEFTHLIHAHLSGAAGWNRSIGMAAMQEGLAIWTSRQVVRDLPEWQYISMNGPEWFEQAVDREAEILRGIRPHLADSGDEALHRFIVKGPGPAGLEREAYYAGYRAVGHLLEQGRTLGQLARLREEEVISLLDQTLAEMVG